MAYLSEKRRTRAKNWARHHIARASGQVQADAVRRPSSARRTDDAANPYGREDGGRSGGLQGVVGKETRTRSNNLVPQLALGDRVRTEPPPHRSVSLIQTTCPPKDAVKPKRENGKRVMQSLRACAPAPGPPAPFPCHSPRQHGMRDAMSIGQSVGRPSLPPCFAWLLGLGPLAVRALHGS